MFGSREEWPAPAPSSAIIMGGGQIMYYQHSIFPCRSGLHPVTLVESQMKRAWMNVFAFVKRRRIEAEAEEVGPLNLCYAANLVTGDFLRLCDIWLLVWLFMLWPWQCDLTMAWHAKIYYDNEVYFLFCFWCFISLLCPRLVCRRAEYLAREGRSEHHWNPDGHLNSPIGVMHHSW